MEVDERLKKELGASRQSRAMSDRGVTERRDVSDADRLQMFQNALFNDALPDLPDIPGYHVCWLSSTNPRDSIHRRMQLGYEPVKPEEVPGMEYATQKTGEHIGFVAVNEMLAFKLPLNLYHMFMQEAHHDAPNREEGKLADTALQIQQDASAIGGKVELGDGLQDLRRGQSAKGIFDEA